MSLTDRERSKTIRRPVLTHSSWSYNLFLKPSSIFLLLNTKKKGGKKELRDDRLKLPTFLSVSGGLNSLSLQWFLIEYPFEVMIAII